MQTKKVEIAARNSLTGSIDVSVWKIPFQGGILRRSKTKTFKKQSIW